MTLFIAKNVKTQSIPVPQTAGAVHSATFTHIYSAATNDGTDIVEIGALPGGCQLVGAEVFTDAVAATFDVGFVTGVYKDASDTRTSADELFDGVARNAVQTLDGIAAAAIPPSDTARGIGVKLVAGEAAGTKYVTLTIKYIA
jgi:hypothetical protein